jgi:hypothetical protein
MPCTFSRLLGSALRIGLAVIAFFLVLWVFGMRMPGKDVVVAAQLSAAEVELRSELVRDVQKLAGEIGERNMRRYPQLNAAAEFIENSLRQAGLQPRQDTYDVIGEACHNIEAEIRGTRPEILVVGAHYDSVYGCPGANDNGSGVAAMLALARRFAGKQNGLTLRFVAFANEEPPYFQTKQMGSFVYASRCKSRGDKISGMISLETIGYFSDAPHSQTYPSIGLGAFYPTTGNFIGIAGNVSSRKLVRRVITSFRREAKLPSQGAALPSFVAGIGWSDQWAFWENGYRGIMVTDTAPFRYPHYHEPTDTPDKLDYDRFTLVVSGMGKVIEDLVR